MWDASVRDVFNKTQITPRYPRAVVSYTHLHSQDPTLCSLILSRFGGMNYTLLIQRNDCITNIEYFIYLFLYLYKLFLSNESGAKEKWNRFLKRALKNFAPLCVQNSLYKSLIAFRRNFSPEFTGINGTVWVRESARARRDCAPDRIFKGRRRGSTRPRRCKETKAGAGNDLL